MIHNYASHEVIADPHAERLGGSMKRRRTIAIVVGLLCGCLLILAGCSDGSTKPVATLHPVEVDGQWGYIDAGGRVMVRPRFEQADDFHEGLASVRLKTGVGFIDATGAVAYVHDDSAGARCLSIGRFSEGLAAKMVRIPGEDPDTRVFYIDRQGETAFTASFFGGRPFHSGLAAVQVNGMALMGTGAPEQWGYIGKDGAFVLEPQYESAGDFSEGRACVAVGDKHGYIDKTGRWVLELPKGTVARTDWSAFSAGLAAVWQGEKAGYIDRHGTMVIAPQFFDARPFAEGLAAVCKASGGLWGYIDKKGTMVIAPQFGQAEPFHRGVARVYLDRDRTTLGYIDKTGKVVWQGKVTTAVATGTASASQGSSSSASSSPPSASNSPPVARALHRPHRALRHRPGPAPSWHTTLWVAMCCYSVGSSTTTSEAPGGLSRTCGALTPSRALGRSSSPPATCRETSEPTHSSTTPSAKNMILFSDGPDQPSYAYDPAANTWTRFVTSGDTQQSEYSLYSVAYDSDNGKVIRFGGEKVNPPESLGVPRASTPSQRPGSISKPQVTYPPCADCSRWSTILYPQGDHVRGY